MSVQPAAQVREAAATDGKVSAMGSGGAGVYQYRKVLNREMPNSIKIVHSIPRSKFTPGCCQNTCKCCGSGPTCCQCGVSEEVTKAAEESTYTWVMENRMEFNRPTVTPANKMCAACCCKYQVQDRINTVHYDNDMYDYIVVDRPPCWLVTTCCGTPGDRISFRRPVAGCPSTKICGMEVASIYVTQGEGANAVQIITTARDSARAQMK